MNVFKKILGEISGKNLTGSEGKPRIFQSRRISTMANREICLMKFLNNLVLMIE